MNATLSSFSVYSAPSELDPLVPIQFIPFLIHSCLLTLKTPKKRNQMNHRVLLMESESEGEYLGGTKERMLWVTSHPQEITRKVDQRGWEGGWEVEWPATVQCRDVGQNLRGSVTNSISKILRIILQRWWPKPNWKLLRFLIQPVIMFFPGTTRGLLGHQRAVQSDFSRLNSPSK